MASPHHKVMSHQSTSKTNGSNGRHVMHHNAQQRMPLGTMQQSGTRFQGPRGFSPNRHIRYHNPQHQHQRLNAPNIVHQSSNQQLQQYQRNQVSSNQKLGNLPFQAPTKVFTKQPVDVVKDTEKLKTDQERLTTIHTQLHNEAEKIRKWQADKEMEIKQKGRSLDDAIHTIDSLRKSIIELQFQNEEYSTKLNDKEKEKEETEQKLNTVREMAQALRDQMVQLEKQIDQGVQDKEEMKKIRDRMMEENQTVLVRFQELDLNQANLIEKHSHQVQSLQDKYENEIRELHEKIYHLENQVIALLEKKKTLEGSIEEYSANLKDVGGKLTKLNDEYSSSQKQVQELQEVKSFQDQELKTLNLKVEDVSKKLEETTKSLQGTKEKLEAAEEKNATLEKHSADVEDIYSKEIKSLQSDLKDVTAELQQVQDELKKSAELHQQKVQLIQDLKHEREKDSEVIRELEGEEKTLKSQVCEMKGENESLMQKHADCEDRLKLAQEDLKRREEHIVGLEDQVAALSASKDELCKEVLSLNNDRDMFQNKIEEFKVNVDERTSLVQNLTEDISGLKIEVEQKLTENSVLIKEKSELKETLVRTKEELGNRVSEVNEKQSEIDNREKIVEEKVTEIEELNEMLELLRSENVEREKTLKSLKEEGQENAESLKTELADKEKAAEDLESKTKSLHSQIAAKTKQLKSLEKENKMMKTQLKSKSEKLVCQEEDIIAMEKREKELSDAIEVKDANLKESSKNFEELKIASEEELNNRKSDLDIIQEKFGKLSVQLTAMCKKEVRLTEALQESEHARGLVEKEKKLCKADLDLKQKNFCATLEKYKVENDSIVESYMKESRLLQDQLEDMQSKYTSENNTSVNLTLKLKEIEAKHKEETLILQEEKKKADHLIADYCSQIRVLELASADEHIKDTKFAELEKMLQSTKVQLDQIIEEKKVLTLGTEQMRKELDDMEKIREDKAYLEQKISGLEEELKLSDGKTSELSLLYEEKNNLKEENEVLIKKVTKLEKEVSLHKPSDDKRNMHRVVPTTPKNVTNENLPPCTPSSNVRGSQSGRGKRVLFAGLQNNMLDFEELVPSQGSTPKTHKTPKSVIPKEPAPRTPSTFYGNGGNTLKTPKTPKSNIRMTPKPLMPTNKYEMQDIDKISPVKKVQKVSQFPSTPRDRSVESLVSSHYHVVKHSASPKTDSVRTGGKASPSPGDVPRKKFVSKKMKKITPKVKEQSNLSWFDTDQVFGFEG